MNNPEAPRRSPYLRTLLLLLLLAAVAVGIQAWQAPAPEVELREPSLVHDLPEIEAPRGQLEQAFRLARPAALKIELRSSNRPGAFVFGVGSGFFISADGLILTAYHVVEPESGRRGVPIAVDSLGREYGLRLVGFDAFSDIALLRAEVRGEVPYMPIATSLPRPGSNIVVVGNSRDDFLQARAGRVTRLGVEALRADFASGTIEMTAALAPGDSGGPVIDAKGRVVGVVSYISFVPEEMSSESEPFIPPIFRGFILPNQFASYAIPVSMDSSLVADLLAGKQRDVPVIGFTVASNYSSYIPEAEGMPDLGALAGVIVDEVVLGGPASAAGLRSARLLANGPVVDVIVAIDGEPTPTFPDLIAVLRQKEVGQKVSVSVQRGPTIVDLTLVLGARRRVFRN